MDCARRFRAGINRSLWSRFGIGRGFGVYFSAMVQQFHRFHVSFARCFHHHGLGLAGRRQERATYSRDGCQLEMLTDIVNDPSIRQFTSCRRRESL